MSHMASLVRRYSESEETFYRNLICPEEDRRQYTTAKWDGSFRWFRSANITPIETYISTPALRSTSMTRSTFPACPRVGLSSVASIRCSVTGSILALAATCRCSSPASARAALSWRPVGNLISFSHPCTARIHPYRWRWPVGAAVDRHRLHRVLRLRSEAAMTAVFLLGLGAGLVAGATST
jgi:hypothetical protein